MVSPVFFVPNLFKVSNIIPIKGKQQFASAKLLLQKNYQKKITFIYLLEEERLISLPQPQPLFLPAQLCKVTAITQKANIPLKILFFIYQK